MAKTTHKGSNVTIDGKVLRSGDPLTEGKVVVKHTFQRPDGSNFTVDMPFTISKDLVEPLDTKIKLKTAGFKLKQSAGTQIEVEFEIIGEDPDFDNFVLLLSTTGTAQTSFKPVAQTSDMKEITLSFISDEKIESKDCYLVVAGEFGGTYEVFSNLSPQFELEKVNKNIKIQIGHIPTVVQAGNDMTVPFYITGGEPVYERFDLMFSFEGNEIAKYARVQSTTDMDTDNSLTFTVPDVESDDCYVTILAMEGSNIKTSATNPKKFSVNKQQVVDPKDPDVAEIETILGRLSLLDRDRFLKPRTTTQRRINESVLLFDLLFAKSSRKSIRSDIVKKAPVLIDKFRRIKIKMDSLGYDRANPTNYNKFSEAMVKMEKREKHFIRLGDETELNKLRALFYHRYNEILNGTERDLLISEFKKQFGSNILRLTPEQFFSGPERISFLLRGSFADKSDREDLLRKYGDIYYNYLIEFHTQLTIMAKAAKQFKKDVIASKAP
jgi:hypothetical protein